MSLRASVLVIGSVNEDITVRVPRFPSPGETLLGLDVTYGLGGKGANQAVAAARTGVRTALLATVGDDAVGGQLLGWLDERGVDTALVARAAGQASGTAHIAVDAAGENQIVVVPGANGLTRVVDEAVGGAASIVVLQGEVPVALIEDAVAVARRRRHARAAQPRARSCPHLGNPCCCGLPGRQRVRGRTAARSAAVRALDDALTAAAALTAVSVNAVITLGAAGAVWADAAGATGHLRAPARAGGRHHGCRRRLRRRHGGRPCRRSVVGRRRWSRHPGRLDRCPAPRRGDGLPGLPLALKP